MENLGWVLMFVWLDLMIGPFCRQVGEERNRIAEEKRLREEAEHRKRKQWESSHLHILAQELYEEMQRNGQLTQG